MRILLDDGGARLLEFTAVGLRSRAREYVTYFVILSEESLFLFPGSNCGEILRFAQNDKRVGHVFHSV